MVLHLVSKHISSRWVNKNIIVSDEKDEYTYYLETILSGLVGFILVLSLGYLVLHNIGYSLLFLFVFVPLREYTGGYHAETQLKCYIILVLTFFSNIVFTKIVNTTIIMWIILFIFGLFILIVYSPIININKPLCNHSKRKNKIISISLFIVYVALGILLYFTGSFTNKVIFFTICQVVFLIIINGVV